MKKMFIIILLSTFSLLLMAYDDFGFQGMQQEYANSMQQRIHQLVNEETTTSNLSVHYSYSLGTRELPDFTEILQSASLPALLKTFAIPAAQAELTIHEMRIDTYSQAGEYLESRSIIDQSKIYLQNDFHFKEMRGFSVFIDLFSREDDLINIVSDARFSLHGSGYYEIPSGISEAFESSYRTLAANYDSSYLVDLQYKKPSMMILSHVSVDALDQFQAYVNWKKSLGFDIHVVHKGTANTAEDIRTIVRNRYNELANKPDYLLIIGGSRNGNTFQIPPFYQTSPSNSNEVTDMRYGIMSDNSYFPDMLVGRFSADSWNHLRDLFTRTRTFEMGNLSNTNNWMTRGIVVAGNYAGEGQYPTTPRLMSIWIRDKMIANGYTSVDTLFWQLNSPTNASTQQIVNAINTGGQILTYRGWGDQSGWHYPQFYTQQLNNINNPGRLPYVYSIVCATGNYNHANTNPCFGELWMRAGNEADPRGAIAFVGPSYLHTSTAQNNSLGSGMIAGIFDDGLRIFGATVMRGRIEMYNNFPRENAFNGEVHFYWATYNMLSDPSLNMWVGVPSTMNVSLPDEVSAHENAITINIPNVSRGFASATRNNTDFTFARIVNGQAILPLPNTDEGIRYMVTISARNFNPTRKPIMVEAQNAGVGLVNHELISGEFKPTYTATIGLTLKNFSDATISNISTTLSSTSQYLNIQNATATHPSLAAGATTTLNYVVNLTDDCPDDLDIPMNLNIMPTDQDAKFSMISGGYKFEILSAIPQNTNENIGPGESGNVMLTITNPGTIPAVNITGIINAHNPAVTITQANVNIGTIEPNGTATATFAMSVAEDCFVGRNARFSIDFYKNNVFISKSYFYLVLGIVDIDAPTGPDNYGYVAFDINDTSYFDEDSQPLAPTYSWIEINPENGGSGTIISLSDDTTQTITLPFNFKFYGETHNRLSINDNGWVAFGDTYMTDFRNWVIPSKLGPKNKVAVFWDDLKGRRLKNEQNEFINEWVNMEVKYWHDTANNRFIVTWDDGYFSRDLFQESGKIEFQVILIPRGEHDGDIIYQYKRILNYSSTTNYSTIGIENPTQTDGICYSFSDYYPDSATPLQDGLAIRFTRDPNVVSGNDIDKPFTQTTLHQNYPNPFNPDTTINFSLSIGSNIQIDIYNTKGQKVKTLIKDYRNAGNHNLTWNGLDDNNTPVGSGIYFYVLTTDNKDKLVKKMVLLK